MSIAARAQDSNGDVFGGAIGKELVQMMDSAGIPGISIAIIRHHKLPYKSKVRHPKTDKTKRTTKPTHHPIQFDYNKYQLGYISSDDY